MKRQDDRPDPSKPVTSADAIGQEGRAELPPRAPFDPPVRDPNVLAILKGLNPSVTPIPMEIATTDGELAATFAAGPRGVRRGEPTPAPEASVVVRDESPPPQARAKAARASADEGTGENLNTTFRLRPSRGPNVLPLVAGLLVVGVGVAFWLNRTSVVPEPATAASVVAPVVTTSSRATVPSTAVAPSTTPAPPPTVIVAPALPEAVAAPSVSAAPATAPTVKPPKPVKKKEEEPERVL